MQQSPVCALYYCPENRITNEDVQLMDHSDYCQLNSLAMYSLCFRDQTRFGAVYYPGLFSTDALKLGQKQTPEIHFCKYCGK